MSSKKKSVLIGGICTILTVGSVVGFAYHTTQPKAITEIIGVRSTNYADNMILIPLATGMYFTEFPDLQFVHDENGKNIYHPNVIEYNEKITAKWLEIDETTQAPREIQGYIRKEGKFTVVEIAGYYTNDGGEQVEYREELRFDFVFDQGYEYFSDRNRDYAPEVIQIPSSFASIETSQQGEGDTIESLNRFLSLNEEELLENLIRSGFELPPDYANHPEELAKPFIYDYFHLILSEEWTEHDVNKWVMSVDSEESQVMMLNLYGAMEQLGFVSVT